MGSLALDSLLLCRPALHASHCAALALFLLLLLLTTR